MMLKSTVCAATRHYFDFVVTSTFSETYFQLRYWHWVWDGSINRNNRRRTGTIHRRDNGELSIIVTHKTTTQSSITNEVSLLNVIALQRKKMSSTRANAFQLTGTKQQQNPYQPNSSQGSPNGIWKGSDISSSIRSGKRADEVDYHVGQVYSKIKVSQLYFLTLHQSSTSSHKTHITPFRSKVRVRIECTSLNAVDRVDVRPEHG